MPAAYTTLTLTGGAATRNLVDGTNYSLVADGWSPSVPGLRRSALAGSGPYDDATEEIMINVRGSTGAIAHANLLALADDLDQAYRWRRGEGVDPILLNIQVQGSDLAAPLSVPIWGGSVPLGLPASYNDLLMVYEIGPVSLRFRRRGQWFGAEETPAATAAQTHPNVFSVLFGSNQQRRLMPLRLELNGFQGSRDAGSNDLGSAAYLVVSSNSGKIKKLEAESASANAPGSGTFAVVTDATASNGEYRRLAPISAGEYTLNFTISPAWTVNGPALYTLLMVCRNNSATINYTVTATLFLNAARAASARSSRPYVIDTSTTNPRIVTFDAWAYDGLPDRLLLTFTPSATSGSANQLDVDVCVALQMTDPTDQVVALKNINKSWLFSPLSLVADPRVLTKTKPDVTQADGGAGQYYVSTSGDVYLLTTGDRVGACLVGTTGSHWRVVNGTIGSSPTAVSSALTATRRLTYRVPQ